MNDCLFVIDIMVLSGPRQCIGHFYFLYTSSIHHTTSLLSGWSWWIAVIEQQRSASLYSGKFCQEFSLTRILMFSFPFTSELTHYTRVIAKLETFCLRRAASGSRHVRAPQIVYSRNVRRRKATTPKVHPPDHALHLCTRKVGVTLPGIQFTG